MSRQRELQLYVLFQQGAGMVERTDQHAELAQLTNLCCSLAALGRIDNFKIDLATEYFSAFHLTKRSKKGPGNQAARPESSILLTPR